MRFARNHRLDRSAEEEGFEPTEDGEALAGFQNRCLKPLGHSSKMNRSVPSSTRLSSSPFATDCAESSKSCVDEHPEAPLV